MTEPLLTNKPRSVPRVDDRRVLTGMFWVLRSGALWCDPARTLRSAHRLLPPVQIGCAKQACGAG